jgi:hypothetical protein
MPELPSYARRRLTKASLETAGFTYRKLLVGACMAVIVRLWHFRQVKLSSADVWADLLIIVGSYGAVVLALFAWNWFRAPALLDAECQQEISRLKSELDLPDKALADHLRALLAQVGENAMKVLRLVVLHDVIETPHVKIEGLSREAVRDACLECVSAGLFRLDYEAVDPSRGCYQVPSEFRETLKRLLYTTPALSSSLNSHT